MLSRNDEKKIWIPMMMSAAASTASRSSDSSPKPRLIQVMPIAAFIVIKWIDRGFGSLGEERLAVAAATLLIVGVQIFFSSFLLSILGLRRTA